MKTSSRTPEPDNRPSGKARGFFEQLRTGASLNSGKKPEGFFQKLAYGALFYRLVLVEIGLLIVAIGLMGASAVVSEAGGMEGWIGGLLLLLFFGYFGTRHLVAGCFGSKNALPDRIGRIMQPIGDATSNADEGGCILLVLSILLFAFLGLPPVIITVAIGLVAGERWTDDPLARWLAGLVTVLGLTVSVLMLAPSGFGKTDSSSTWSLGKTEISATGKGESKTNAPSPNQPEPDPAAGIDPIAAMDAAYLATNGNGWRLEEGTLKSPETRNSFVPLPGKHPGTNYLFEFTLQRGEPGEALAIFMPMGERIGVFYLDGYPKSGFASVLAHHRKPDLALPPTIKGKAIQDNSPHRLQISFVAEGETGELKIKLDDREFYQWKGDLSLLRVFSGFGEIPKGQFGFLSHFPEWTISSIKITSGR